MATEKTTVSGETTLSSVWAQLKELSERIDKRNEEDSLFRRRALEAAERISATLSAGRSRATQ